MKVEKYSPEYHKEWDFFIDNAKNPLFMHKRDFMEYHSDRFEDCSLMFFDDKDNLVALLPANVKDNTLYSHQGLTYGGFIVGQDMKQAKMIECFSCLKQFMEEHGITKLFYKTIPHIFHKYPCEEDLYALFRNNAKIIKIEPSTTILLPEAYKMPKGRKAQISRAKRECVVIEESTDFKTFIDLENKVLIEKHNTEAVHTAEELELLHSRFPEQIRLYIAKLDGRMIAGSLIFEYEHAVHTQYLAADETAREIGGLDLLIKTLIDNYKETKTYFDFGISTEDCGKFLNEGLISQKEGFGGRTVCYTTYEISKKDKVMENEPINKEDLKPSINIEDLRTVLLTHFNDGDDNPFKFELESVSGYKHSDGSISLKLEYIQDSSFAEQKFRLSFSNDKYEYEQLLEFVKAKILSFHYPSYITKLINNIQENIYNMNKYLFSIDFALKLPLNKENKILR